jgi:nitrous oxidase accessory protein
MVNNNSFSGNSFDIATNGKTVMNGFDSNYWDHYEGYDLNRDGVGDVPYHPVSLFSVMVERVPESLMLYRSFLTFLLDKAEHVMPSITPEDLVDNSPLMKYHTKEESYATN